VPWLNDEVLDAFPETRSVASPLPLTVILAHLLAPLRARCQDLSCRGTLMRAASARGRAGIEELSSQVVAMFNSRKGPRKVFSRGLAFDVEPICEEALDSNWAPGELSVARELGAILNLPDGNLAFTQVILPTFTGACLSLQIEGTSLRDAATCGDWLAGTRGLLLDSDPNADGPPRPRRADRKGGIQVGRLRDDPGGRGVHLWATSDEIVFGGAGNALSILRALLQRGYLEAPT
jgi:aspartate-semialdehyde dehydrogenase